MNKRILLIQGHPDADSFCAALADAYERGAARSGADLRRIDLHALRFNPNLHSGYKRVQKLEPDLRAAQDSIRWARHVVFVYPVWWGSMPAQMKGFLDRVFHPGFGFKFRGPTSYLWDKLLTGRSARIIVTMDGPPIVIRLLYKNPAIQMMKGMTLEFCGFRPVRVTQFGPVKRASRARRLVWTWDVEELGERLA